MRFSGGPKVRVYSDVKLVVSAAEPATPARPQRLRLVDLGESEDPSVEIASRALACLGSGELNMIDGQVHHTRLPMIAAATLGERTTPRMKEEDRQRTIRVKLARQEVEPRGVIPTGFASLDAALGVGGLPRGRIVEIYGPAASGKTTLALQIVAHRQKTGATTGPMAGPMAGWIDADCTFDPAYATSLGVEIERMPIVQPDSAEQGLEIANTLVVSGALDVVVIDSAAALVPRLELEIGLGESGHGLHSRVLASGLRRMAASAARTGTCAIFVNQIRTRKSSGGEDSETTAGGPPLKLFAAARIALCPVAGGRVRFRVVKNKAARAFGEGHLTWSRGPGFSETP